MITITAINAPKRVFPISSNNANKISFVCSTPKNIKQNNIDQGKNKIIAVDKIKNLKKFSLLYGLSDLLYGFELLIFTSFYRLQNINKYFITIDIIK